MRLIDADALLQSTLYNPLHGPYITDSDVKNAPTIKQELVRCKDCKYGARLERTGMTPLVTCKGEDHELNWFCADGERK